jgi:GAF domain-containing protein
LTLPTGGDDRDPGDLRWRQVLNLGAALISASPTTTDGQAGAQSAQRRLILDLAERLTGAQATLWLAPANSLAAGRMSQVEPPNPTDWMQRALEQSGLAMSPDGLIAAVPLGEGHDSEASSAPAWLGALQIERRDAPFSRQQLALLEGIALQAAQGLRAVSQTMLEHWRVEQLGLVQKVSAQIANLRDLDEVAQRVTRLILETFDYYYVAIYLLDAGQSRLTCHSAWMQPGRASPDARREDGAIPASPGSTLRAVHDLAGASVGEGIIGHVAQTGQERLARDVGADTQYAFEAGLPETRSELALPLKIEERLLGVLDVQSNLPDDFNETDLLVLRALASNIALAIEGAAMYATLGQRAEQLTTLFEIGNAVSSILDPDEMLHQVAGLIQKRFGYPYIHLYTIHAGREKIFYAAGSGARSQSLLEQAFSYDLDDPEGIIPWVARHGETVLANNVGQEPRYRPLPLQPDRTQSELTVPIIFGGEVLGVMDIQSEQVDAFNQGSRLLFEALAGTIAIAFHNAQLYRSEQFQRLVADSLREVTGLLTTDTGLEQVLQAILKELDRTLPCDLAAVWLVDDDLGPLEPESKACPPLRLAAVNGASSGLLLEVGTSLATAVQALPPQAVPAWTWLAQALHAGQPITRQAGSPYEPLGVLLDFPQDYSAIAAPLRIGDRPLGILLLLHATARRYGTESSLMTAAFASYAAVAIENARLYEASHEQAWISTVLLEVTRATQEIDDLDELLQTVTAITPTLTGVKACLLYLRDEKGVFMPAAASGLEPGLQADFERWKFSPGDVPALDRLVQEQTPSLLALGSAGAPLTGLIAGEDRTEQAAGHRRMVLVPLVSRGEMLGTFLIEYEGGPVNPFDQEGIEDFSNKQLAIAQGIARQTALAMENLRLSRLEEEEAYVSVALLQVAQSIVSNIDLEETLGTIVRLTSILIGAKRTALFLLEDRQQVYRLSQAYGLGRSHTAEQFAYGDFLLLDALREQSGFLACLAEADSQASPDILHAWKQHTAPDLHQVGDYLAVDEPLLLVLPLAIQNELLGALIIEEHLMQPGHGSRFVSSNRRLREKRLEIATGISQQAALAIQSDRFQRSLVERERMERELQLAHDIQRSLLPPALPSVPGWELGVLWKTAREVGGDFYDLFELPDGNLGLAIADVSDKGMPAALYMTHVHALLRAMAQTGQPPAEVLQRINEAMAGDETLGMFVTLIYGVLSPRTGRLVYANAGHNRPILLQAGSAREIGLPGSSMALGVECGQPVEQAELVLQAGEALVLYTDGVTEAFSPQGSMFGQEQLLQVIEHRTAGLPATPVYYSAQNIVNAIEENLSRFRGDLPLGDDLTLLVVSRLPD